MEIMQPGTAGTLESSDIMIILEPTSSPGIQIQLSSPVEKQFGDQIRAVILCTLDELGIGQAAVMANDRGALDCVIKSRVQTAVYRAANSQSFNW